MPAYLADSSVLLDVFTDDRVWAEWSVNQLERASANGIVFQRNTVIDVEILDPLVTSRFPQ